MANVIELIKKDHRKVEELFSRYSNTSDPREKEQVLHTILVELRVHAEAEEGIIYPIMDERDPEAEELEEHAQREHDEIKNAMAVVETSQDKEAAVAKLKEVVEHHVKDEEEEFLPGLEQRMGPEQAETAAREWEEFKLNHPSF